MDWPTLSTPNRAARLLLGKTEEGWLITFGAHAHHHLGRTEPTWDRYVQVTDLSGDGHHFQSALKGDDFEGALAEAIAVMRAYTAARA